ncbi:hypothetical protein D3C81_1394850 [compost metagenome]
MRAAAHGPTVYFRQGKGGALGGHDNVGCTGNADAATEDETVHGDDDRHRVAMYRLECRIITGVDRYDAFGVGVQFLDVDTCAEAAAFGTDDDHPDVGVGAQGFDLMGQVHPLLAAQGIDRRFGQHQLSNARLDLCGKCLTHEGVLQSSAG